MYRLRIAVLLGCTFFVGSLALAPGSAAGGGCHPPVSGVVLQERATTQSHTAAIDECRFEPTVLYVDRGAVVTWINNDAPPHSVTGVNASWGTEKILSNGDSITHTFPTEGVFPYYCLLHPGMAAAVVVGDPDPEDVAAAVAMQKPGRGPAQLGAVSETSSSGVVRSVVLPAAVLLLGAGLLLGRRRRSTRAAAPGTSL